MRRKCRSRPAFWRVIAGALVALLLGAMMLGIGPALGELRYTTKYSENPIRGTTPEQLWRFMAAHPIIDEDGPALANITHDHTLSVASEKSGRACRVANIDFTWRFVITLPKAVDKAGMSPATGGMWREFTAYLKGHEEHHRTIFLGCGKKFLADAAKITGGRNCFGFKRKISRFIEKKYDACMKKQRAFDRQEKSSVANLALRRAYRK